VFKVREVDLFLHKTVGTVVFDRDTNTNAHNCFTALLDIIPDYLGELAPER